MNYSMFFRLDKKFFISFLAAVFSPKNLAIARKKYCFAWVTQGAAAPSHPIGSYASAQTNGG